MFKFLLPVLLGTGLFLEAAPRRYEDDLSIVVKEMRDTLDDLRREVYNHESEIRTFENRVATQEESLGKFREEFKESTKGQKEILKTHQGCFESRLNALEGGQKALISDLKQIRNHSMESQELFKVFKDKMISLEKNVDVLTKNLEILQSATHSLVDALKPSQGAGLALEAGRSSIYKVKAGDSLEKIARQNRTTIKVIKELNHLTKDTITVGQNLKLPE